ANGNYVQIINEKNLNRLKELVDPDKVYLGGETDDEERVMTPTILANILPSDKVMNEEIFGPILPVIPYDDLDSAISYIKTKSKPLSLYLFTNHERTRKKILDEVSFG